jgi:hypothetical protein
VTTYVSSYKREAKDSCSGKWVAVSIFARKDVLYTEILFSACCYSMKFSVLVKITVFPELFPNEV